MKAIKFRLSGDYAHFKVPYTNNNPLTYSFITKTALMGLIGAVIGIERKDMKRLFPLLCDNLKYSVAVNGEFKKESISTYSCNLANYSKGRQTKVPRPMEYVKNPDWDIYVVLSGNNTEVEKVFENFCYNLENDIYIWRPTFGIKQCICNIDEVEFFETNKCSGDFKTKTFVVNIKEFSDKQIIYNDNIPTHQNDDWFNDPKQNVSIYFTDNKNKLESCGEHYKFKDESIFLL
jgi:CRISPR-associated protein Cas5h